MRKMIVRGLVGMLLLATAVPAQDGEKSPFQERPTTPKTFETMTNGQPIDTQVSSGPIHVGSNAHGTFWEALVHWKYKVTIPDGRAVEFLCDRTGSKGNHPHSMCQESGCGTPPSCGEHVVPAQTVNWEETWEVAEEKRETESSSKEKRDTKRAKVAAEASGGAGETRVGADFEVERTKEGHESSSKSGEDAKRSSKTRTESGTWSSPKRTMPHFAPCCCTQLGVSTAWGSSRIVELTARITIFVPHGTSATNWQTASGLAAGSRWINDYEVIGYDDLGQAGAADKMQPVLAWKTGPAKLNCQCRATAVPTPVPGRGSSHGSGTPSAPTPPAPGPKLTKPKPGAPKAPAGKGGDGVGAGAAPADGGAQTSFGTVGLDPLINFGSIGAGDKFATAITVGSAETAGDLRTELETGGVTLTQNGQSVPFAIIDPPSYADAFAPDPDTTIWVETTVIPSSKRQVDLGLQQPASSPGGNDIVIAGTTFLAQPRATMFTDGKSVGISVTGSEAPWGEQDPKFELHPKNTDAMSPSPNGADETGIGSTIIGFLTDTGIGLVTAGGLYYVGTLLEPDGGADGPTPPGARNNPNPGQVNPATPTTQGLPANGPLPPNEVVSGTKNTWTIKGHNDFPTGATPANGNPAITNVSGMSGVVIDPNFTPTPDAPNVPYLPALKTGDTVTVSVAWGQSAGAMAPDSFNVVFMENGAVVATLPPISATKTASGADLVVQVNEFVFGSAKNLEMVVTSGTKTSPGLDFTTVVFAEALVASAAVSEGGVTTVPFKVFGSGILDAWVVTAEVDSANLQVVQGTVFGEGQGGGTIEIRGNLRGAGNLFLEARRVE